MTFDPKLPYTCTVSASGRTEQHESFGLIQFLRTQGTQKLFGSSIENHTYITLRIAQAERGHEHSREWFYPRRELIEVSLSAAQFAELITSLNMGSGVPCTIHRVLGTKMEPLPAEHKSEAQLTQEGFEVSTSQLASSLRVLAKSVRSTLEKKTLTVADRKDIINRIDRIVMEVESNLPHILSSFQESVDKGVSHAKAEVESFLTLGLQAMGISSLKQFRGPSTPSLPPTKPDDGW